jgi:hypothetical protein
LKEGCDLGFFPDGAGVCLKRERSCGKWAYDCSIDD